MAITMCGYFYINSPAVVKIIEVASHLICKDDGLNIRVIALSLTTYNTTSGTIPAEKLRRLAPFFLKGHSRRIAYR
jgi:hypothetical protein